MGGGTTVTSKLVYYGSGTAGFDRDRRLWAFSVVIGERPIKRASVHKSFCHRLHGADFRYA